MDIAGEPRHIHNTMYYNIDSKYINKTFKHENVEQNKEILYVQIALSNNNQKLRQYKRKHSYIQ